MDQPNQTSPRKVLIVEDDPAANEAFARILRLDNWLVYQAHSVAEARHMLKSRPDVVLLDLLLPDGEGLEVLRYLRNELHNEEAKVIILTGRDDDAGIGRLWANHISGYLRKPVDLTQLFFLIKTTPPCE